MTFLTLRMFCLQNRSDIVRVEQVQHVLGFDVVVVTFDDESSIHLRFEDGAEAERTRYQLGEHVQRSGGTHP